MGPARRKRTFYTQVIFSPSGVGGGEEFRALHMIVRGNARWEAADGSQPFGGPAEAKFFYEGKGDLFSMPQFLRGPAARTPGELLRAVSVKVLVSYLMMV